MKNKNLLPLSATLLGSGLRWPFLFESIALGVHVFPGIDGGTLRLALSSVLWRAHQVLSPSSLCNHRVLSGRV